MKLQPSALRRLYSKGGWLALALALALVGCSPQPTPGVVTMPAATPPRPQPVSSESVPPAGATPAAAPTPGPLTLTWWAPEFLGPKAPQPAGSVLGEQLAGFEAAQDGKVRVAVVPKARYGRGGLLDFLRTAQPVAPAVLPDVVALDVSELEAAAEVGLLQPLDGLLAEDIIDGLYPFAVSSGRFDGRLLAVQYAADIDHLVYRPKEAAEAPPTWTALLEAQLPYLLPINSAQPGSSGQPSASLLPPVISQYLSAWGSYDPAERLLKLEEAPLLRLLNFYNDARQAGILSPDALELPDTEATWSVYAQGKAPLADVSARRYIAEGASLKDSGYAAAPGWSGPITAVPSGWALAITATDPARQRAAADLIAWLLKPENAGSWAQAGGWLPTSPAALRSWGSNPYYDFLSAQLTGAVAPPAGPDSAQAATRIRKALEAVVKGESEPAAAAQAALNPPK